LVIADSEITIHIRVERNICHAMPFHENSDDRDYEGHWQPGNTLAFLKGLGDPALANGKGKALMRVLAKSPNGAEDLGLRARQVKTLVEWEDPPQLRKVLSRISLLLARMGQRENWLLADYAGNLARKIVAFKLLTKQPVSYKLGDAIIAHTIEKFSLKTGPPNLKVENEDLQLIRQLENATQKPKRPKPTYQTSPLINSN